MGCAGENLRKKQPLFERLNTVWHAAGVGFLLSVFFCGWSHDYIAARLSFFWIYLVNTIVTFARSPRNIAPRALVLWLHDLRLVALLVRSALISVAFVIGAWAVGEVVPPEVLHPSQVKAITVPLLLLVCVAVAWKRHRSLDPLHLLYALRLVANFLVLWLVVLWVEDKINLSGAYIASQHPVDPQLRVCAVYVNTFNKSPRKKDLIPQAERELQKIEGASFNVYEGRRMPLVLSHWETDPIIRELIRDGYLDSNAVNRVMCGANRSQKCLRPNHLFDRRLTNIGSAMGHIKILE
eukprot:1374257-Amorphochlora_amoeboformis.AAC.2